MIAAHCAGAFIQIQNRSKPTALTTDAGTYLINIARHRSSFLYPVIHVQQLDRNVMDKLPMGVPMSPRRARHSDSAEAVNTIGNTISFSPATSVLTSIFPQRYKRHGSLIH